MITVSMNRITYLREIGEHDFLRAYSLNLRRAELDSGTLTGAKARIPLFDNRVNTIEQVII
jgi:hypothetical protein